MLTLQSDPLRRSLRGLFQIAVVQGAIQLYNVFAARPLTPEQVTAITLFCTPLLALAQNLLEDHGAIPAFGKAPASDGSDPVPEPTPPQRNPADFPSAPVIPPRTRRRRPPGEPRP